MIQPSRHSRRFSFGRQVGAPHHGHELLPTTAPTRLPTQVPANNLLSPVRSSSYRSHRKSRGTWGRPRGVPERHGQGPGCVRGHPCRLMASFWGSGSPETSNGVGPAGAQRHQRTASSSGSSRATREGRASRGDSGRTLLRVTLTETGPLWPRGARLAALTTALQGDGTPPGDSPGAPMHPGPQQASAPNGSQTRGLRNAGWAPWGRNRPTVQPSFFNK